MIELIDVARHDRTGDQRAAALRVIQASKSRTLTGQSLEIENRKYRSGTSSNLFKVEVAEER